MGDPVAVVVAESRYLAEDAASFIEVDYEDLRPVASVAASRPGQPAAVRGPG